MEIVVCVKPVPEGETRLRPAADGRSLDEDGVKFVLAGYDESAVEQALLLKEANPPSAVHAISVGRPTRCEEVLRQAIALGCDTGTVVEGPADGGLDPIGVAAALSVAVRRRRPDLVLVGKRAADDEAGLVGPALAGWLKLPDFPAVTDLKWDAAAGRFTFVEVVEGGTIRGAAPGPLVVALQQAWNDPRTAKLPNILRSRRAALERIAFADVASAVGDRTVRRATDRAFRLPPPRTGARLIEYKTPDEAAARLVKLLTEEAKVLP